MELFADLNTTERIAWGLLSFIALIVYLRWEGTPEDRKKNQKKNGPPEAGDRSDKRSNKY
jgi:hypothetical protein